MLEEGWVFNETWPDHLNGKERLYEIYLMADPTYSGRVSVPVLWDKERQTIVSNESSEIIRMLNSAFDAFGDASLDFYPEANRLEIDALNAVIYENVNNGVYKAGFAQNQEAYEEAFRALFNTLDELDQRLDGQRFLMGDPLTEADWRLFTTLIRFDAVYYVLFKCNRRRIADYPEPLRLSARSLPGAGHQGHRRHRPHQAALLLQPEFHQSDPHRAARSAYDHRRSARPRPLPWNQHPDPLTSDRRPPHQSAVHQSAAGALPLVSSLSRAFVPGLASSGGRSTEKNSAAMISPFGSLSGVRLNAPAR